jgi:hypothetical protein
MLLDEFPASLLFPGIQGPLLGKPKYDVPSVSTEDSARAQSNTMKAQGGKYGMGQDKGREPLRSVSQDAEVQDPTLSHTGLHCGVSAGLISHLDV